MYNIRDFISLISMLLLFIFFLSLWGFYSAVRPFRIVSSITPKDFNIPFENVEFETQDKVMIRGWFIPNKNPKAKTIILLHGYPADKGDIFPSRIFLHKNFNLLFIDFRYLGSSGGHYSTVGKDEVLDVLAAIDYLKKRGMNEVGIWGLSMGGAVAIMAAKQAPEIKAIVAESSYASLDVMALEYFKIPLLKYPLAMMLRVWGLVFLGYDIKDVSPAKTAAELQIPILIMHSKNDGVVSFVNAELLQKSLEKNAKSQLLIFDNLQHGELTRHYQSVINDFFKKYLAI